MSLCDCQLKSINYMKKIIIALATLATIAACNKAEVVEAPQGDAIAFGDAFVDNSTKAIYNEAKDIKGFTVWGNVEGTNTDPLALYPEGATVTRGSAGLGEAWTCSVARYWTPLASYNFTAIANGIGTDLVNGIPTKISYSINSTDPADLIYGATTAETNESAVPVGGVNSAKVVTFTMQHLLSRIQVAFQNLMEGGDYTYDISDITLTTWDKGVYTIAPAEGVEPWERTGEGTVALLYPAINSLEYSKTTPTDAGAQVVIPGSSITTLAFTYELKLKGSNGVATTIYTETVNKDVRTVTLEQGHSYSLNVQLQAGGKIDFTLTDTGLGAWEDNSGDPITI